MLAAVAVLVGVLVSANARAEGGLLELDWGRLANAFRDGGGMPQLHDPLRMEADRRPPISEMRWFNVNSHLSLVARDWGNAQLLLGHLALTDQMRLIRSSRMVIGRLRVGDGRIVPFLQVGAGQWRIDTDLMPVYKRDVEIAGQLGGGIEFIVSHRTMLALETDETVLYREQHEPQRVASPHQWGTLLAARAIF